MKKLLRIITMALTISILMSILCPNVVSAKTLAQTDNMSISQNREIIKNPTKNFAKNISYDNLSLNINDKFINKSGEIYYRESEQEYTVDVNNIENMETTSLLNDSLTITALSNEGGTSTKNATDNSISVKIILTVNYIITGNSVKMTKITSKLITCNGSTTSNVGSGVFIISNNLTYGQIDAAHSKQNKSITLPNNACTNTYTPSNWSAVSTSAGVVGATHSVTLRRGNSKWYLTLTNNIVDSMPMW